MFKGLAFVFALILFGFCFYSLYAVNSPVLKSYAEEYELYLTSGSFGDNIVQATENSFKQYKNIKGESCFVNVSYERVLKNFGATHVFSEPCEGGVSYYAYSPKIRYRAYINGRAINLQYYAGELYNKLGSPLIYGSF